MVYIRYKIAHKNTAITHIHTSIKLQYILHNIFCQNTLPMFICQTNFLEPLIIAYYLCFAHLHIYAFLHNL